MFYFCSPEGGYILRRNTMNDYVLSKVNRDWFAPFSESVLIGQKLVFRHLDGSELEMQVVDKNYECKSVGDDGMGEYSDPVDFLGDDERLQFLEVIY